ncbi:unnamed protein product [Lactuca saligna]|uniref:Uncharacterized protein n=1 Tax=Lactuca saligna TaxID=75948 RepID=A0AA36EQA5_LACSI|nr:unnamed protein product [Lactuca saligna]
MLSDRSLKQKMQKVKIQLLFSKVISPCFLLVLLSEFRRKPLIFQSCTGWNRTRYFTHVMILNASLDFPLNPRVFLFRCFQKIEKSPISNGTINRKLFNFYLKFGKP